MTRRRSKSKREWISSGNTNRSNIKTRLIINTAKNKDILKTARRGMPSYHRLPGNPVSSLSYKDASKFIASSTLSPMCNNFAALSEIPNCAMCSSTQLSQHHEASWSSQRNRARSAASEMARNADVFPPDASSSNAKSTIAYSFTKKEKKKVSTTERERKRCKLKLSLLFLLFSKWNGFFIWATTEMDGAFSFDIVCEFRHPQMLLSSPSLKKLFFIVVRKEGKSKKDIN